MCHASKSGILRFALNSCASVNRCYITITQRNCERGKAFIVSCWLSSRRLDRRIKKTDSIANSRYTLYSEML